jgi:hypothetical protein
MSVSAADRDIGIEGNPATAAESARNSENATKGTVP